MNGPLRGGGEGGDGTCPTPLQPVRKGSVHSKSERSNSMILLLLDNHTQLQRPLADKKKKKKQSRARTTPQKKEPKRGKNKIK